MNTHVESNQHQPYCGSDSNVQKTVLGTMVRLPENMLHNRGQDNFEKTNGMDKLEPTIMANIQ